MSLTHRMTEMDANPFGLSAAGQRCFHCGEFVTDPAIMWNGADGQTIYLHGLCIEAWTPRIMRDALELKYQGKACWSPLA